MKQLSTDRCSLALPRKFYSLFSGNLFPKYFFIVFVLALMVSISSCQKDNLQDGSQGPNTIGASMNKSIHDAIPFKASYTTNAPTSNQINGTGVGTLVGKSTFSLQEDDSNFPLLVGTATITTANGDQIFSTHSGSVVGPDDNGVLLITNYNTITGGTGRFANASGNFVAHAIANINYPTGTVTFDGSITLR
ncbi:hypothetical protein FW778_22525 [Ginsengibacter hankyongi]|uniref:Uncharacterized protein n=1 Tax=Ginsengibacter hankyongi TaxID=2607284 RepID=A0A5J5IES9_9BACT|nr:hypothetical protein [Ginsengibacter hankyongi]KAA9034458.1 hypothetical protein FW778_22525 [Ginsengibacter hankyongi]